VGRAEDAVEVAAREVGDARGERDRLRVRVGPVRDELELAGLVGAGLRDLLAAVPDVRAEQRAQPVEVAVAVLVEEVAALAAHDDGISASSEYAPMRLKCTHRWRRAVSCRLPAAVL
jgi:hypothetical protein